MTELYFEQLEACGQEMAGQRRRMDRCGGSLAELAQQLQGLQGLGEYASLIRRCFENLEKETLQLRQMEAALGRVREVYRACEQDVAEHAEGAGPGMVRADIRYQDLAYLGPVLEGIHFR